MKQLSTHFLEIGSKYLGRAQDKQLLFKLPFSHVVHPLSQGLQSLVVLSMYLSLAHLLHETPSVHSKHEDSHGLQVAEALSLYYPALQLSTHFLEIGSKYLGRVQDEQTLFSEPASHVLQLVLQLLQRFVALSTYFPSLHVSQTYLSGHVKHEVLHCLHIPLSLN